MSRDGTGVPSIRQSKAKKVRQKVDDGLTWGEQESDGFCMFEVYGPDDGHLYGYGGVLWLRGREHIRRFPELDTTLLNSECPPVFQAGRRYARTA